MTTNNAAAKNETARLNALAYYEILDSGKELGFENIAFLASQICETPIALINFLDDKRQWFKAKRGITISETPLEQSICQHTIKEDGVFEVNDTLKHDEFKNLSLVTQSPKMRFYAGAAIKTAQGVNIGTVCVIDNKPRLLSNDQRQALQIFATQVMFLLEERKRKNNSITQAFQFKDLFDNAPCGYHSINVEGIILEMNETELQWLGYERSEVIGKLRITDLLDEDGKEVFKKEFPLYLKRGYVKNIDLNLICKDGRKLPVMLNSTAIFDEHKNLIQTRTTFFKNSERKQIEADLMKSREMFRKVFDKSPTAMLISDAVTGKFMRANQIFLTTLGFSENEVLGRTSVELNLLSARERETVMNIIRRQGFIKNHEVKTLSKNGETITFIFSSELMDINGRQQLLSTFHDITEIKTLETQLILEKNNAENAKKLHEQFVADMSHEIRTPMNSIIGFTDILLNKELGKKENEYLEAIKNSGKNLLRIINDVLDLSKLEAQMVKLEEHPFKIQKIFYDLEMMLKEKAQSKNLELIFECATYADQTLVGDTTRTTQILTNLITNAIKFTWTGSIKIVADVTCDEQDKCTVGFSVTDTGIGIPENKLQSIFERFEQVQTKNSTNNGGSGLGLSITKQLIKLQGGEISVTSTLNKGTRFYFTIPFKKPNADQSLHLQLPESKIDIKQLSNLKILLAEDNPINIHFFTSLFSEYNLQVETATNGNQVIEMLRNKNYDVLLLDVQMPEMDGYETTAVIRYELKNNIPIIAMTAHAMVGEREKCLKIGMNDYVSKPVNVNSLFEKISSATEHIWMKNNSATCTERLSDFTYLVNSMRGKERIIQDTFDIILRQVPNDLFIINDAIAKSDFETINEIAHKMKSAISILTVPSLQTLLEEMENNAIEGKNIEYIKELNNRLTKMCSVLQKEIETERIKITAHLV